MSDTPSNAQGVKALAPAPAAKTPRAATARKAAAKRPARPAEKAAQPKRQAPAAKTARPARTEADAKEAPARKPKQKVVRDSFTMPSGDFQLIEQLKGRAIEFKRPAKKSELLRAGLHALMALSDARLKAALDGLAPLKPGRPKKTAV